MFWVVFSGSFFHWCRFLVDEYYVVIFFVFHVLQYPFQNGQYFVYRFVVFEFYSELVVFVFFLVVKNRYVVFSFDRFYQFPEWRIFEI